jgi:ligand-binding sensor domain-containing protein
MLSFFAVSCTKAQESFNYSFRHITQADGLLHNDVYAIVQDGKGFMWIATNNGLQRYDGSRFINYPETLTNPAEGHASGVEMYADKKNNLLWVTNNSNLEKMELAKNHFTVYTPEELLKDPSFIFTSYRGANNESWVLGRNAVYHYDSVTKKNVLYQFNIFPPNTHQVSFIVTDSTGNNTLLAAGGELHLFDKKSKRVYSHNFNPGHHPLLQLTFYATLGRFTRFVMMDSYQNIWVTTWGDTLYKYNDDTKNISRYSLSAIKTAEDGSKGVAASPLINCISEDDNHTIWIGTENAGLLRYNPEKDNFDYSIVQEKNSESIRYNYKIFSLFQDKEQNIWIGTDKGISIFNPYRQYFKSIRHEENNSLSISKNEIISFIQTINGAIFIGTWGGGIALYDSSLHFKKNIAFNGPHEKNFIWSFLQFDDNTLWIGCQYGYLLLYDMGTGATQTLHPPEMNSSTIPCMEKDDKGNIWFGLHNGRIIEWDREKNKFFPYGAGMQDSLKIASPINNIFIDRSQHCWVSTNDGFKEFDLEKRVYINTWLPDKKNVNSISGKTCHGIEEYDDSTLLIGTIHGGLNFFNKKTKTFSHLTTADGLPSNTIYAIKKDAAGYVWFTTDYGLYKFNPAEKKIIPYSIEPGVINTSFASNKFYPLQDGQWLTFTGTEAISFLPRNLESQIIDKPKTEITGFKLFDKPVFIDSLLFENKPVRLSYKENFFTVEFAALNFSGLQQTNYYYRLGGIDKDWVNGETKRFANYTDLQPGEYIFEVKAENGTSIGETTSFKIIIAPPFWKTTWFSVLILLLAAALVYFLFRRRIAGIRHEAAMKQKIAETEMMALRAQMNPHFIFNCINSIDALIQSNDKYQATVYLNKFAKLIRNILDSSKQNTVTLAKDLDTLKLYIELEQLRHENKFTAEIKADDALLQDDYKVPPLIIQPFVENAILHGIRYRPDNKGKLSVSVTKQGDYLRYIIEDNGVGRNTLNSQLQKEKLSYGIDMSNDRVKLFNNEEKASVQITDLLDNDKPSGTKVAVLLKIQ